MTSNSAYAGDGPSRAIIEQVYARSESSPRLTAVRHSGQAATYGDLAVALEGYEHVTDKHFTRADVALPAAVLHCLPNVSGLGSPESVAGALGEIYEWLGRDSRRGETGRGHLRAVG
ncbi:hypothetical protein IA539_06985 [Gordonia sp. zg691]|uniref:Uncharacterized protein n=1 Tax=Gordonia jinghuaiqii TaxID=2758710 RepID=A0A7D7LWP6_9ACTN|nr:hypothetical protein [Gordonia jinghuaiqii]MBD0860956.1 hypothetical protein [Gordonia jinghuaiqii]MCR5979485.1 hypothetical protein [Gordonia jinghuaiqii]QMT00716.1 hypothetical protein H1R19_17755 [Gordonia jinghuaiqii]